MIRQSASEPTEEVINRIQQKESGILVSPIKMSPTVSEYKGLKNLPTLTTCAWKISTVPVPEFFLTKQLTPKLLGVLLLNIDEALLTVGNEAALKARVTQLVNEIMISIEIDGIKQSVGPAFREKMATYLYGELLRIRRPDAADYFVTVLGNQMLPNLSEKIEPSLFAAGNEAALKLSIAELVNEEAHEFPIEDEIREKLLIYLFHELKAKNPDLQND
jgi:hypothetical protein